MEDILIENVSIPVDDGKIFLNGSIYYTNDTPEKTPWIINIPAFMEDRNGKFVKIFTEKFAKVGYYVLAYDPLPGKQTGRNWIKFFDKIFFFLPEVISWILDNQKNRILDKKIALFGRSYGGAIILTQGFKDIRAKFLIALCTRYDYATVGQRKINFGEELIRNVSPKFYLNKDPSNNNRILIAHCKDDETIPFENLSQIKEQLGLNDENVLIYDTGGHSFKGNRENLFQEILKFLKKL
ncbi:hypothetical protein ES703_83212 [subsurface metagenome]